MAPRSALALFVGASFVIGLLGCGDDDTSTGDTSDGTAADGVGDTTTDATVTSIGPDASAGESTGRTGTPTGTDVERCEATDSGSEVTVGTYFSPGQLDPTLVTGGLVGGHEVAALYDVLFLYDYETDSVVPRLAESMTPNDDYTVWTLRLKDGITYSDGTPLTAQLVADNIDRYFAETATSPARGTLEGIERKRVIDDRTLELTLKLPWYEFPKVFADQPGMIVNTKAVGKDPAAFAADPPEAAGLGPYVLERNAPNEEIVLRARDDYWDGPVCIERLRFVSIPGAKATYDAFRNGELDAAFLREEQVVAEAEDAGIDGWFDLTHAGQSVYLNHADGRPAADPRIREAIWLALDDEAVNSRVFEGTMLASKSLIHPDSSLASDALDVVPTDPDRAADLVDEAKADGYDGSLELVCPTTPPSPDAALTYEGLLEAVGFDVTVKTLPAAEHIEKVFATDFDASCWGLGVQEAMLPTTLYRSLHSSGTNFARTAYRSAEMDRALEAALAADTPETQREAVAEVNNIFGEEFVAASLGAAPQGMIWQPELQGVVPTVNSIFLFHEAALTEG